MRIVRQIIRRLQNKMILEKRRKLELDHATDSTRTLEPNTDSIRRVGFCKESCSLYISEDTVVNGNGEEDNALLTEYDIYLDTLNSFFRIQR